ncbi:MAG TPA: SPFH domain-containing protein, partial [Polyangiaceae bacterium]|nr:SPFH domain-containing protein [Polyangiaceae bacterium]
EGWYVVLKNPACDETTPKTGTVNGLHDLQVGHKVNIPGPVSFALWPGQMVRIVKGHHLRSNQYLVVRVYDEDSAEKNWGKAVIKPQTDAEASAKPSSELDRPELTMGKLLVIKGTEVSFYIPPTGVEIVRDVNDQYVREAVTLERLEYCILLDEDGNKRFITGPAVVFPEPTETFVERSSQRKFKAIELNELSGLYIKVIAPYEQDGRAFKVGEELFITGKEQMIYFPRPEHALIRYGEQALHYAVAIPAGEGRYCLDRDTGKIQLIRGPRMFLADPRREVMVRRVLDSKLVRAWFPGNEEALAYNQQLQELMKEQGSGDFVFDRTLHKGKTSPPSATQARGETIVADGFPRKTQFTPPRTITLDTKYEGAVTISVWTGYAVMVVSKSGSRKVVVGPSTHLLEYDETLEGMALSTATPKSDDKLLHTAYVRVLHNKVSDVVHAQTKDICSVEVRLSYRVNFEGDPNLWFNVENYVKFLTDHMRSLLRHAIKQVGVQEFYASAADVIRNAVLGRPDETGTRTGRQFPENGMRIYDVEILDVTMGDEAIEELLTEAQHAVVSQTLELEARKRRLEHVEQSEMIERRIAQYQAETKQLQMDLSIEERNKKLAVELADVMANIEARSRQLQGTVAEQKVLGEIKEAELGRAKAASDLELAVANQRMEQRLRELRDEVEAVVKKANAISPELIAALQAFGDRAMVERVAQSMAPLAILGGKSVAEVMASLLKGTALERVLAPSVDTPVEKPKR